MNSIETILLNFSEIRRRSIKLWESIPESNFNWKPDKEALSIIEMIRHVLESEHLYHVIVQNRGNLGDYKSPWLGENYVDLKHELNLAEKHRENFVKMISEFSEADLDTIRIVRSEVGQNKKLGDYLNRIAYHESVHTGQMLGYLRMAGIERPKIWD